MINYTLNKKDFSYYLKQRRRLTNIIFLIFGSLIYFYITFYLIFISPFETFEFYIIYLIILLFIILLFNQLYCYIIIKKNNILGEYEVTIKQNSIEIKINNNKFNYQNKDIKKIIKKKNYILIKYKNHLSLFFLKKLINDSDYNKLIQIN